MGMVSKAPYLHVTLVALRACECCTVRGVICCGAVIDRLYSRLVVFIHH